MRVEALRRDMAEFCDALLTMSAKQLHGISGQELSDLRRRGGSIAKVAILMDAICPDKAMVIGERLHAHARARRRANFKPLRDLLTTAAREDADEDVARDALREEESAERLRGFIRAADDEIAAKQALRDEAARRLAEIEQRGQS